MQNSAPPNLMRLSNALFNYALDSQINQDGFKTTHDFTNFFLLKSAPHILNMFLNYAPFWLGIKTERGHVSTPIFLFKAYAEVD